MVVKISLTEKVTFQQRLEKGAGVGRGKVWRKSCGRAPKARVCQHVPETTWASAGFKNPCVCWFDCRLREASVEGEATSEANCSIPGQRQWRPGLGAVAVETERSENPSYVLKVKPLTRISQRIRCDLWEKRRNQKRLQSRRKQLEDGATVRWDEKSREEQLLKGKQFRFERVGMRCLLGIWKTWPGGSWIIRSGEKSQLPICVWPSLADRWCSKPRYHHQGGEYEVGWSRGLGRNAYHFFFWNLTPVEYSL